MRTFYPGAWYVDALPSGEYCVLFPSSHVDTHRGALTLPPGEGFGPLYLRCSNVGGFKFAGQAHDTLNPAGWEWSEGNGWRPLAPPCVGVSPLIYDRLGILHSSDGSIGSQGWRYCLNDGTPEGHLVTGDQTYTREVAPGVLIHEYTEVAGPPQQASRTTLLIGQGHDGGTVVWDGAALRLLESGDGRFVRVNIDGDRVAVSFVKSDGAVIVQTTLAELRALPRLSTQAPPIVTPPLPQPKPEPKPMEGITDAQLATLKRVRSAYPAIVTIEQIGAILNETAWIHRAENVGMELKPGGTAAVQPRTGLSIWNGLRFIENGEHIGQDVLGAASVGRAEPYPGRVGPANPKTFVAPVEPEGVIIPAPVPVPVPPAPPVPTVDLSAVLAELQALTAEVARMRLVLSAVSQDVDTLIERPAPPPAPVVVFPKYTGTARLGTSMRFTMEPQP